MSHISQHIAAPSSSKTSKAFFGRTIQTKPFFSPVLQLKPDEEKATETTAPKQPDFDLAEFNRQMDQAKKNLCQLAHDLFKQAVTTGNKIGRDTPTVLDTFADLAATCSSLSSYIKLKPKRIAGTGVYKTYAHSVADDFRETREGRERFDANDWHNAVKQGTTAATRDEIAGVGGFYNRDKDTINLPQDATIGSALHEGMHRLSGTRFRSFTRKATDPDFLSEGATQYFTDKALMDFGMPKMTGHNYGKQVAAIENLVRRMNGNFDPLARLYFQDDISAFREILFGLGLAPDQKTMIANPGQKIYDTVATP